MPRARILGTGLYAPERVVPNSYFDALYGEDVSSFLVANRNIRERRYAAPDQAPSDLAVAAARQALDRAGVDPEDLNLIVVSTDTPDYLSPATASVVQHKLGAVNAGTFDLNTACAGFVTALDVASKYVAAEPEQYGRVLVVGTYLMSRFLDFRQRNIASLFADGAGAVVVGPSEDGQDDSAAGILASMLEAEGQYAEHMGIYAGGAAAPIQPAAGDGAAPDAAPLPHAPEVQLLEFRQKFPKTFNLDHWTRLVRRLAERTGVPPEAVDRFFFTQINVGSIRETMDALGLPQERAHLVMDRYGYTGNACVAMALADADQQGLLTPGQTYFLIASGGGASLAAMAVRW